MRLNTTTIIVIFIALLLTIVGAQQWRIKVIKSKLETAETERSQALEFIKTQGNELQGYTNKDGFNIKRIKQLEASVKVIEELKDEQRLKFLKQFEGLRKDLKNLKEASSFDFVFETDSIDPVTVSLPCKDSLKVFKYVYKDDWNDISAMVVDTPRLDIRGSIKSAIFWKRPKKFLFIKYGKKEWFQDCLSENKLIKITGAEVISVQKASK